MLIIDVYLKVDRYDLRVAFEYSDFSFVYLAFGFVYSAFGFVYSAFGFVYSALGFWFGRDLIYPFIESSDTGFG